VWTGKQSAHAPVWFTGVMGTARWKGSAGNRGRPVLVEGRAFSIELRHSGEAHALADALFGGEEGGIVTRRIGEEAAASELGIECKPVLYSGSR
jgi:hypothetical protein